jgi:hypothetical protein
MFAKSVVQFPTLGYWPGFPQVATSPPNEFSGPFALLGGVGGCRFGGSCTGDPATLGFFDSGLDLAGWGLPEWAAVGAGAYLLFTSFLTTKRGVARVRKGIGRRASRRRRVESLKRQLSEA